MSLVAPSTFVGRSRVAGATMISPRLARGLVAATVVLAAVAGALATDGAAASRAAAHAGPALVRLLRGMAALKALMALGAGAAVIWRLGSPVAAPWLAAYAAACAAMAAGPGLIWGLVHLGVGAAVLHAGVGATLILLWRDPAMSRRLAALVAARRALLAGR